MKRIAGVDLARGLAVLGMITAHVGVIEPDFWTYSGWLAVADGRSAATFVVLAGVSVALLSGRSGSGGSEPAAGPDLVRARIRIAARAGLLLVIGLLLAGLGTPVAVILPSYGAYFLLVLPTLRVGPVPLFAGAAAIAVLAPPVCFAIEDALARTGNADGLVADVLVSGYYPAGIWMAYLLTGLAVGRLGLHRPSVRRLLLLAGPLLAALGYLGGAVAVRLATDAGPEVLRLLTPEPHTDTTFEVVGNIGIALGVLGLCLVVADRWPRASYPVASTGALALSAYSFQIVAIAMLGPNSVYRPDVATHLTFLVVTVVTTTAWRAWIGRGPLERIVHQLSTGAADAVTGSVRRAA